MSDGIVNEGSNLFEWLASQSLLDKIIGMAGGAYLTTGLRGTCRALVTANVLLSRAAIEGSAAWRATNFDGMPPPGATIWPRSVGRDRHVARNS
jgi:hypothetical protein